MNTGPFIIMLAASLWAVDALIRTPLTRSLSPAAIVFLEHVAGIIVFSPVFFRARYFYRKLTSFDWVIIFLMTAVSSVLGTVFFTKALSDSFSTGDFITPLLLQKTQPLFVIFLSILFLKEKMTRNYLIFTPLALMGSYLMSFGTTIYTVDAGKLSVVLFSLGATLCWGTGTILSKYILGKLTPVESTGIRFLLAIPISFIVVTMSGEQFSLQHLSAPHLLRFIMIALSTGAGALILYYKGLANTEAKISTLSELSFPLLSLIIGLTPLNPYGSAQILTLPQFVGIALLVIAVSVITIRYATSYPAMLTGIVVRGSGDGKKLGFPTANISTSHQISVPYGVYAGTCIIGKKTYQALIHWGPRLVFGEKRPQLEAHILDFDKNIYGSTATICLKKFIRPTLFFHSKEELKRTMDDDLEKIQMMNI